MTPRKLKKKTFPVSMLFDQRREELRKILKHRRVLGTVMVMLKVSGFFL